MEEFINIMDSRFIVPFILLFVCYFVLVILHFDLKDESKKLVSKIDLLESKIELLEEENAGSNS